MQISLNLVRWNHYQIVSKRDFYMTTMLMNFLQLVKIFVCL